MVVRDILLWHFSHDCYLGILEISPFRMCDFLNAVAPNPLQSDHLLLCQSVVCPLLWDAECYEYLVPYSYLVLVLLLVVGCIYYHRTLSFDFHSLRLLCCHEPPDHFFVLGLDFEGRLAVMVVYLSTLYECYVVHSIVLFILSATPFC